MKLFSVCEKGESVQDCTKALNEAQIPVPVKMLQEKYGTGEDIEELVQELIKTCGKNTVWENDKLFKIVTLLRDLEG